METCKYCIEINDPTGEYEQGNGCRGFVCWLIPKDRRYIMERPCDQTTYSPPSCDVWGE